MYWSKGAMASRRHLSLLLFVSLFAISTAGPLGPLPNVRVTSADLGLKEGGCAVGDVVYLPGDEFPGASACERCRCENGSVSCARTICEPRPGCKALHRPDHCCPTYQCECEQEGRVYGNGEKLVDPQDPCRVCYCQGGEVVCRRIACFRRDDCIPRAVPGRCCPEYDNCPLRGVSAVPGVAPSMSTVEEGTSLAPTPPRENIKQEITIKEITPVSEIPVLSDVKVKEILPTPAPGIEVPNYSSSKSPVIVREATPDSDIFATSETKIETPVILKVQPLPLEPQPPISYVAPTNPSSVQATVTNDSPPSKISFSTQDLIDSDLYPAVQPSVATKGAPAVMGEVGGSRAPVEEEETSLFEHNPAFPPLPDDLSVIANHEEEQLEQLEVDQGLHDHNSETSKTEAVTPAPTEGLTATNVNPVGKESVTIQAIETFTHFDIDNNPSTANNIISSSITNVSEDTNIEKQNSTPSTKISKVKDSPMLNLRSAIPTDILNIPSFVPEEITDELDEEENISAAATETTTTYTSAATEIPVIADKTHTELSNFAKEIIKSTTTSFTEAPTTTEAKIKTSSILKSTLAPFTAQIPREQTPEPEAKSNIVTEITAQTEFSSLPIETSDQNPRENSDIIETEKSLTSPENPTPSEFATTKTTLPVESEVITVYKSAPTSIENHSTENIETTEFVITTFGSSESVTDNVELIKISAEPNRNAAIIDTDHGKKNSVLTDLINLVGDVASIGDHTDAPASPVTISDSEELILVNAGYKSKNNNWNQNSITEMPVKTKSGPSGSKQKVIEIVDDEVGISDAPAPHDRVEPTTRRPIIDSVDDAKQNNQTEKKDIEIITKSYVPTISRRPTKVVMKKSGERLVTEEAKEEGILTAANAMGSAAKEEGILTATDAMGSAAKEEGILTTTNAMGSAAKEEGILTATNAMGSATKEEGILTATNAMGSAAKEEGILTATNAMGSAAKEEGILTATNAMGSAAKEEEILTATNAMGSATKEEGILTATNAMGSAAKEEGILTTTNAIDSAATESTSTGTTPVETVSSLQTTVSSLGPATASTATPVDMTTAPTAESGRTATSSDAAPVSTTTLNH